MTPVRGNGGTGTGHATDKPTRRRFRLGRRAVPGPDGRVQGLVDAAPDAIIGVDGNGRISLVNTASERLFGYHRDELLGELLEILLPESARAVHPERRRSYAADPRPRTMGDGLDIRGRRKDGTEFPAEIFLFTTDSPGGPVVSAIVRDVTGRLRGAQAEAELAAIVRSSHDAVIGETLGGVITSWNPGAEGLYGYRADEIIGANAEILIPLQRRAERAQKVARLARGDRIEPFQTELIRKDGTVVAVAVSASPIADASGQIVGIASTARDISERQRAETKFRGLLEAAPDAVLGVDQRGTIAFANAQAERLFGYDRRELEGQPVEILVPEAARGIHPGHRAGYFADPTPRPMGLGMRLAGRRKDGTEFPAEISLSALETEDGVLVSAAVRDVTERIEIQAARERIRAQIDAEKLEAQLQQSQRLEALGQLAGGVAHDFNNLLGAIINYAAFVGEEVAAAATDPSRDWTTVQSDVAQIQRAAERASQLTHQLLAFARREVAQPQVLTVNDVVSDVEQLLRRTIGEHVQLDISLMPGLWAVLADRGQIEQVLVNLAVNARDAMPRGGTLTIETFNVTVDESYVATNPGAQPGRHVRLRVSDTGVGMEPDVLHRAFEPFYTTKPKGEGSGLGLATVYGIITQSGGVAHIYSEPGLGTTFTALFPVTEEHARLGDLPAPPRPAGGGETILVVEDEEGMRDVTERILTRNGYRVLSAADGPSAIELVTTHPDKIDLLVTDVVMPQMLGKEVAERVLALKPGVRVLYMSGYAQPVLGAQGTLEEGVTLVEKPFSQAILLAKVSDALSGAET